VDHSGRLQQLNLLRFPHDGNECRLLLETECDHPLTQIGCRHRMDDSHVSLSSHGFDRAQGSERIDKRGCPVLCRRLVAGQGTTRRPRPGTANTLSLRRSRQSVRATTAPQGMLRRPSRCRLPHCPPAGSGMSNPVRRGRGELSGSRRYVAATNAAGTSRPPRRRGREPREQNMEVKGSSDSG